MALAYAPDALGASTRIADVMHRLGARIRVSKDQEIFVQDQAADLVHLIVYGAVRTTRLSGDGRRQVGAFYYAGELIGLETGSTHRFSAEALCDGAILILKRQSLQAFAGDAELDRAIWEATTRELERTQDHLMVLGRKTARERVASFLMDLASRHSCERVDMPMGRQDMADYLGLTIETVSRMLTQLQSSSVVAFDGSRQFRITGWPALARLAA